MLGLNRILSLLKLLSSLLFTTVPSVNVKSRKKTDTGWIFQVEVSDNGRDDGGFTVDVDAVYWKKLTGGAITPERLVRQSFEFLLKRESKESILRKFNLKQITTYFPEYEKEMKSGLLPG